MDKISVRICLGSSCYTRGNSMVLKAVKGFIKENSLEDKVDFRGMLCMGRCNEGPIVKINEKIYTEVDSLSIIDILKDYFKE